MVEYRHQINTKGWMVLNIEMLCRVGKYGVEKSSTFGTYKFDLFRELGNYGEIMLVQRRKRFY